VKLQGFKKGSVHIAQGSVEWWLDYKKVNAHRMKLSQNSLAFSKRCPNVPRAL
jgi:hypothetical protein